MFETIFKIVQYGRDGNAAAVSSWSGLLVGQLRARGMDFFADRIAGELTTSCYVSPFDCGWWNAFSSFAEGVLSFSQTGSDTCIEVLEGAGISRDEADRWLGTEEAQTRSRAADVVRKYISSLS